mmetsp:Transcript_16525/g.36519  ORF Transcript_16525/g.36519 Transcript_16525/m.36519 type:complete len:97 (-) Transcript_16525:193-483(-)
MCSPAELRPEAPERVGRSEVVCVGAAAERMLCWSVATTACSALVVAGSESMVAGLAPHGWGHSLFPSRFFSGFRPSSYFGRVFRVAQRALGLVGSA